MNADRTLLTLALAANGMITGAALDQTIKQLPARHEIGLAAYSAYAQAADLSQGVPWYGGLAISTALLTLLAVAAGLRARRPGVVRPALWTAAAATVGYLVVTAFAAPTYHSQRDAADEVALAQVFDRFVWLNAARATLIVAALVAVAVALLASLRAQAPGPVI